MKRAQIRVGALVGHDFRQKQWPIGDLENVVFDVKDTGGDRFKCTAPGFGGIPYGNGSLFVERRDLLFTEETAIWFTDDARIDHQLDTIVDKIAILKEGFLAALRHLDDKTTVYVTRVYVTDPRPWLRKSVLPTLPAEYRADIEAICKALILKSEERMIKTLQDSDNPL